MSNPNNNENVLPEDEEYEPDPDNITAEEFEILKEKDDYERANGWGSSFTRH